MEITLQGITLVAVLGHIVVFLFRWGKLNEAVETLKKMVEKHAKYGERIAALEVRAEVWNTENTESESPIKLTDKGSVLLKESGAEEFIEKNKESLLKHFEGVHEPFDIQTKALKVSEQELQKDRKVKEYLFQKGAKGVGEVAEVAGIALRDIVFKEKEIQV